jgi:hypothetical protein
MQIKKIVIPTMDWPESIAKDIKHYLPWYCILTIPWSG